MILVENIKFLRKQYPHIREFMLETQHDNRIEIINSRGGLPTVQVNSEGRKHYLHSKYDPLKEADRLLESYKEAMNDYEHVFFYGIGLGYHIEKFLELYPSHSFTMYEPNNTIFEYFLSNKNLNDLPLKKLKHLYVEKNEIDAEVFLHNFSKALDGNVLLVMLPSYERIFTKQYNVFGELFKKHIKGTKQSLYANIAYQKRWIGNSLVNFPTVSKTPNILHDIPKEYFKEKPVIIVAAGPSLQEEIKNLRHIKENGLAYIFSIGSAINALITHNIYPDAALTYDPSDKNQFVFKEVVENNIDSIPLIFGTSVAYEVLQNYKGPKVHMITSQDTISPYLLVRADNKRLNKIHDATSISVLAIELLQQLEVNPIILVGQNLAYKNGQHYSEGINYSFRPTEMTDAEKKEAEKITVEDVYGNTVMTKEAWKTTITQIEYYLNKFKNKSMVFNSTKGGAKINGTTFKPLENIIKEELYKRIVINNWFEKKNSYDKKKLYDKLTNLDGEKQKLLLLISKVLQYLQEIEGTWKQLDLINIENALIRFKKSIEELMQNDYFSMYLHPMSRVQFDIAQKQIKKAQAEENVRKRLEVMVKAYKNFINDCKINYNSIEPHFDKVVEELKEDLNNS